ncbi:hypothetical protein [uncultured Chitinophaga sp.]|jgi:hypothetical protein|uniref:hypothetical protein n=1 Tax=uncultured Chitinophaga sp. TaxID=339340 RepID=UPI002628FEF8|nr:hypothetical protein [uncultured Chitinophaga sp.]
MSTDAKKLHYPSDAGEFISLKDADRMIGKYGDNEKQKGRGENYTQAYFFGKEKILELLNCHEEIVGIRIYYGMDLNGDGVDDKKMVLYAVNKEGKNVPYKRPRPKIAGLSFAPPDPAPTGDPVDDGGALDGGLPCPSYCP